MLLPRVVRVAAVLRDGPKTGPVALAEQLLARIGPGEDVAEALECAASARNVELARRLVRWQTAERCGRNFEAAVRAAIRAGDLEVPPFIAEMGKWSGPCQHMVEDPIRKGFLDGVRFLVELTGSEAEVARNALPLAIKLQESEIVADLLSLDKWSRDRLVSAVQSGSDEIVAAILATNSCPKFVNRVTACGTALCAAADLGNVAIVERLLETPGIDPNLTDLQDRRRL
jgi:hypothetical protein